MKRYLLILLLLIAVFVLIAISRRPVENDDKTVSERPRSGIAIIMTGAAARIPQEAALLEELDHRGLLKDLVFISGVSSGALNAVILNGIIEGKISWDEYKSILFNLRNKDIFIQNSRKLPVDTKPARDLYKKVVEDKLGYYTIGELPIPTGITITHLEPFRLKKKPYRMCSIKMNEESDTSLSLVDIMMASSAFPIAFPPVKIGNIKTIPDDEYVDGGVGEDIVPFRALLEFEEYRGIGVEKVFIISRKSDSIPKLSEELQELGLNDRGIFDKFGISIDAILKTEIVKRIRVYASEKPELVPLTYVWIPDFKEDFMLFNFEKLEDQYTLTSEWAKKNDPVLISEFLKKAETEKE